MASRRTRSPHPVVARLRAEAERRDWTAYRLAQETGLGINTVKRVLDGTGNPSLDTISVLGKALGLTIEARSA